MAKEETFVIEPADPFKNDALNRKECAESLKRCVSGLKRSEVICIDAAWGEGKTTFLQMWAQMLRNEKFPVIWFNAWENDFSDDPFVCLLGEVGSAIDSVADENKSKAQAYLDQAKKCATVIARRSIPVAAKLLTAGLVETDKIVEQTLAGLAEQIAKEQIEKYEKAKQTLKGFRESLENFAQQVSAGTDKPLIFVIDELDRCRPSFAIGLLEKAKHLFNVDGIVFVLAADKRQLGSSIKSVYGPEIDVNGYLRRFFDFVFLLPSPDHDPYVDSLFSSSEILGFSRVQVDEAKKMLQHLALVFRLSLREQRQCVSLLCLSSRMGSGLKIPALFLVFLIVLKINDPTVYRKILGGGIDLNEIITDLKGRVRVSSLLDHPLGIKLEAILMVANESKYSQSKLIEKHEKLARMPDGGGREGRVAEAALNYCLGIRSEVLQKAIKQIELARFFGIE